MKKNILIWGAALLLVVVAVIVTSVQPSVDTSNREKATDFKLKDLYGNTVSLSDYRGQNVYLNFFATWCPPCKGEMPDIEKIHQKYKDKGLVVLAVDVGEDNPTVNSFIQQYGYTFKVLMDFDQSVGKLYQTDSIPVSVFIDKDGNIVSRRVGSLSLEVMEQNMRLLGL